MVTWCRPYTREGTAAFCYVKWFCVLCSNYTESGHFLDIVRLPIHVYLARTATAVVATAVSRAFVFCEMWTPSVLISLHSSLTGTGR